MNNPTTKERIEKVDAFFKSKPDIAAILCAFSGEGDSGSINCVNTLAEFKPVDITDMSDCDGEELKDDPTTSQAAEDIAYAALEKQGVDWYNNDGGFGVCVIDRKMTVHLHTETRYVQTNTHEGKFKADALTEV